MVVSIPVHCGIKSLRTLSAMTISSKQHYRPFAKAVNAFNLPSACLHTGQAIGNRQPQIIVAMSRQNRLVHIRHALAQHGYGFGIFLRHGVAHRVGNINRGRTGLHRRFDNCTQKIAVGAGCIFRDHSTLSV